VANSKRLAWEELGLICYECLYAWHGALRGSVRPERTIYDRQRTVTRAPQLFSKAQITPMVDEDLNQNLAAGPNDEATTRVIYNYGMTMFLIQVLEHQLVSLIVASNLPRGDSLAPRELKRIREDAFRRTLGVQLKDLAASVEVPEHLKVKLARIVAERNHLAHSFFREHHADMQSLDTNERLVAELFALQQFVVAADDELTELERSLWKTNGLAYPY
jgi:hypothetical protein